MSRFIAPLEHLKTTIADSATFRSITSTGDRDAAKARIFFGGAGETESPPLCIIRHMSGEISERLSTTSWSGAGPLRMFFIFPHPSTAMDWNDAYKIFADQCGEIIDEMEELVRYDCGAGPYLAFNSIALNAIGQWDESEEGANYWEAEFTVFWKGM